MKRKETTMMSNEKNSTNEVLYKITKTSYDKILQDVSKWPEWKKNICNQELIVSVKSKKI